MNNINFVDGCIYNEDEDLLLQIKDSDFEYCCGCTEISIRVIVEIKMPKKIKNEIKHYFKDYLNSLIIATLVDKQKYEKKLLESLHFKRIKRFKNRNTGNFVNVYSYINRN